MFELLRCFSLLSQFTCHVGQAPMHGQAPGSSRAMEQLAPKSSKPQDKAAASSSILETHISLAKQRQLLVA